MESNGQISYQVKTTVQSRKGDAHQAKISVSNLFVYHKNLFLMSGAKPFFNLRQWSTRMSDSRSIDDPPEDFEFSISWALVFASYPCGHNLDTY